MRPSPTPTTLYKSSQDQSIKMSTPSSSDDNDVATMSIGDHMTALQNILEKEQEDNKAVVIDAIQGLCTEDSPFEILRSMGRALENGNHLVATAIAGGKTNFSYKIHLDDQSPNTSALYAKIAYNYALSNIDRTVEYDLKRMDNEFFIMNKLSNMMREISVGDDDDNCDAAAPIVATPFAIRDLSDNSKLLVTQWVQVSSKRAIVNVSLE
jgi:hypothetical protein